MSKKKSATLSIAMFLVLQLIKPFIVILIYKELTDFHPTIINNYELYLMVFKYIIQGGMKPLFTIGFILAEIVFLAIPYVFYTKLHKA